MNPWCKEVEREFFMEALEVASPEQLFYITDTGRYLAYWPKGYGGKKETLQSRNAFVGEFTEGWSSRLLYPIASELSVYVVQKVVCEDVGLTKGSPADIAICRTEGKIQKPEDILMIVEVKMSVVWNWEYEPTGKSLSCVGDYKTHQGNPGLLRSDTMLKAIGKSINIRISSFDSARIPVVVLGNTPVTKSYYNKVDHLRKAGVVQGFYSVNPAPVDDGRDKDNIKATPYRGFLRCDSYDELKDAILSVIQGDREFFSGMKTKMQLGRLIELASKEISYERKAEMFLSLLRNEYVE